MISIFFDTTYAKESRSLMERSGSPPPCKIALLFCVSTFVKKKKSFPRKSKAAAQVNNLLLLAGINNFSLFNS